jgi:hypothetical protein
MDVDRRHTKHGWLTKETPRSMGSVDEGQEGELVNRVNDVDHGQERAFYFFPSSQPDGASRLSVTMTILGASNVCSTEMDQHYTRRHQYKPVQNTDTVHETIEIETLEKSMDLNSLMRRTIRK